MREFWFSSGYALLDPEPDGRLGVTDALLRAYLARPELVPPAEACAAERRLHGRLLAEPRAAVAATELAGLADAEAQANWAVMLAFRDHLLRHRTVEAAYLALVHGGVGRTPPMFVDQLAQLILRHVLDGCADPLTLRTAELFFRRQRVAARDGAVLLADEEIVERQERSQPAAPLLALLGQSGGAVDLDVLGEHNAPLYWQHSDAFDLAVPLPTVRTRLAPLIALWVRHLLGIELAVEPLDRISDERWRWFVGLDVEATRLGNALWRGRPVAEADLARVLALYRATLPGDERIVAELRGQPAYLILAMNERRQVTMKPQNLVAGLPLVAGDGEAG